MRVSVLLLFFIVPLVAVEVSSSSVQADSALCSLVPMALEADCESKESERKMTERV